MAKNLGFVRLVLWIGIIILLFWFLTFCFAPESMLASMGSNETHGYFLRLYGIFPLSWAILFLFALKDPEKNRAIINAAIITGFLTVISIVVFHFLEAPAGWYQWVCAVVLFIYTLLLSASRPKAAPKI